MAIFPFSLLAGCRNTDELEETIQTQKETISDLNQRIVELEQQQSEDEQLILELEVEIEAFNEEIENMQPRFPEFRQGLVSDLMENIASLTVPFLGYSPTTDSRPRISEESIIDVSVNHTLLSGRVITNVSSGFYGAVVILSYWVDTGEDEELSLSTWTTDDWQDVEVNWEVMGYILNGELRLVYEREPRILTDLETVTIRMYDVWDGYYSFDAWGYREETILGSELWQETLRLMPEVWDLWYEGSILYVDLMSSETVDPGGSRGDFRAERLARIFSSFPHVSEIRFLTMGQPGLRMISRVSHRTGGIVDVEAGRWITGCQLEADDPWFEAAHPAFRDSEMCPVRDEEILEIRGG